MFYLMFQMCLYLIGAALIGGVIGWLLKSFFCDRQCEAKVGEWKAKYAALEGRYASLEASGSAGGSAGGSAKMSAVGSASGSAGASANGDGEALKAHINGLEETNRLQADRIADLEGRLTAGADASAGDAELSAENARLKGEVSSLKTKVAAGAVAGAAVGATAGAKASGGDAKLEAENRKLKGDLDASNKRVSGLEADLKSAKAGGANAGKLEADLAASKKRVASLEGDLKSAKASGGDTSKLKADLDACKAKTKSLDADLSAAKKSNTKLQSDLDACGKRSAQLETDLAACKASKAAAPAAAPKPAAKGKKEKFTTDAPAPASLLKAPQGDKDNLQEIWGVGPVMEKTMNKLGIFHFRQVAGLSKRDVEWVSANINTFPDRIERDKWVPQAAELHLKKYGKKYDA